MYHSRIDKIKPPLDPSFYKLADDEAAFFKAMTGIQDAEDLKRHILSVQAKAYDIFGYPCIRRCAFLNLKISRLPAYKQVLKLGQERRGAILLDMGCCFGNDVRKAVADGWPMQNALASDLRQGFWDAGHELFKTTPEAFPLKFVPGDLFDPAHLAPREPFYEPPSTAVPDIQSLTSLTPLQGHISVIHVSAFFHLFGEDQQQQACKAIASLLSPEPGSTIFGSHIALPNKGFRQRPDTSSETQMFCHDSNSWKELWGQIFEKGSVDVEAQVVEVNRDDNNKDADSRVHMLIWSSLLVCDLDSLILCSAASSYFYLPVDEDEDLESTDDKSLIQASSSKSNRRAPPHPKTETKAPHQDPIIADILSSDDLYRVLGVERTAKLDTVSLRRAYLRRSRACHPECVFLPVLCNRSSNTRSSKSSDDPEATSAFQKVSVAYEILSNPTSRRVYDRRPASTPYNVFAASATNHAEETFRGVILGIFNEFLDGDLEVIRTLLKTINDINPSLRLGDEGINSVISTLQGIRERALSEIACRACIYALHAEISRLIEVQHAFRQLSYFDLMGRSRLTIQLTRITLSLPIALERAMGDQTQRNVEGGEERSEMLPRQLGLILRGMDGALERMERVLT
ncbi:hypothetical protein PC9H_009658 [Pleurotus ostreatus]|uniref:J domain-containing protein n=1 Tax=Pleurotus ostreatus TaxID=5322 RepID=A0A8H6ZR40_PLEOS|nr:uncharacterized protein PC9H_009658 [Pleurotus ostreatus]KAF7424351.1 hypothetical protein PC9H_009658 [Pleurotus ostreatus]